MNRLTIYRRWRRIRFRLAALWRWLTEPVASIRDPQQRRQAQLLASLLVSVVPLGLIVTLIPILIEQPGWTLLEDPEFRVVASATLYSAIAYRLSRTRHYKVVAVVLLLMGSGTIFVAAIPETDPVKMNLLVYLVVPILLASALLSLRATFILVILNLVGMLLFARFAPRVPLVDLASNPLSFVLLASMVALLIARYRELLEGDRRALLAQNEQRLRQITDNMHDLICQVDLDGIIQYASPSFYRVLGYPPERLVGQSIFSRVHPDDVEMGRRLFQHGLAARTTGRLEHRAQHADGHYLWLEAVGSVLLDGDGVPAGAIIASRDITERKRAEERLHTQTERLQMIFDHIPVMVVFFDAAGRVQMVNQEYERTLGWSQEEVQNHPDILAEFYPDPVERERVQAFIAAADSRWEEFKMRVRDGRMIDTLWANVRLSDGSGMGIGQHITERKRMEQRQFELAVEKERADILRQFLGHASHDLRTPLTIIKTSIYLLRRLTTPDKRERHLDMLEEQANHLQKLLDDFLSMSRLSRAETSEFHFAPLDLNRVVAEVLAAHQTMADQKHHQVDFAPNAGIPALVADETHLKRAFTHLVFNAMSFTPAGGRIAVEIDHQDGWVIAEVRDTGIGIKPLDLPRIFDPFFRADKARSLDTGGTGLGLAIVQRIIVAHGGRIEVESTPGEGSVFRVWLPLARQLEASQ